MLPFLAAFIGVPPLPKPTENKHKVSLLNLLEDGAALCRTFWQDDFNNKKRSLVFFVNDN